MAELLKIKQVNTGYSLYNTEDTMPIKFSTMPDLTAADDSGIESDKQDEESPRQKKRFGFRSLFSLLKRKFSASKSNPTPTNIDRSMSLAPEFFRDEEEQNMISNYRKHVAFNQFNGYSLGVTYYPPQEEYDNMLTEEKLKFDLRIKNVPQSNSTMEDYTRISRLGAGSFGTVYLGKDRHGTLCALKFISLAGDGDPKYYAELERNYLYACNSPFIVSLYDYFMVGNYKRMCLVMENVNGCPLSDYLMFHGPLSEDYVLHYTAQLVMALEYMHNVNLIHRDLKPGNIMITSNNYVKLIDFGLSKRAVKADSYLGTMGYKAPEMIIGHSYTKAVDWWSLGIIIYEMFMGTHSTPCKETKFTDGGKEFILMDNKSLIFPKGIPKGPVRDLISRLLHVRPKQRLGSGESGSQNVKRHPWFSSVNWIELHQKSIQATPHFQGITSSRGTTKFEFTKIVK